MSKQNRAGSSNDAAPATLGQIIEIAGARATVLLNGATAPLCPPIGSLLIVDTGNSVVLCMITAMRVPFAAADELRTDMRTIEVELVGEVAKNKDYSLKSFQRGVSSYPKIGDLVRPATAEILGKAYEYSSGEAVEIGTIQQDSTIPAVVKVDDLMGKHLAIVGSTGSGKSCTTALILRQVLAKHPNAHIVLLDPHNEYGYSFGESAEVVNLDNLRLPYWFLTFEEIVEVLIGDPVKNAQEIEILRDLIPAAKRAYASNRRANSGLQRSGLAQEKFSVDVPVPYRLSDLTGLIDAEMGKLDKKNGLGPYKSLRSRLESLSQDQRYSFMFGSLTVEDNLKDVLKQIFRIPVAGKPISIIQLTGLPSEIVNVLVSVLARLAFDLALLSEGKAPITFVCEEAHRYIPGDSHVGFEPTKRALSRIAKEGRKYGISLCIVSQRPGDLDPTILSQCSTLLTMRLSNEADQSIVTSALSDAARSLLDFLPSLGTREAIIFGEGVNLPSRIVLTELPPDSLPRGTSNGFAEGWSKDISDDSFLDHVITRWRMTGQNGTNGSAQIEPEPEAAPQFAPEQQMTPPQQFAQPQQMQPQQMPSQPQVMPEQVGQVPQQVPPAAQQMPQQIPQAPAPDDFARQTDGEFSHGMIGRRAEDEAELIQQAMAQRRAAQQQQPAPSPEVAETPALSRLVQRVKNLSS